MNFRRYQDSDAKSIKNIAFNGEEDNDLRVVCSVKCDYYIDNEADNCFVMTDEFDKPAGAILCSSHRAKFMEIMPSYLAIAKKEYPLLYLKHKMLLKAFASVDKTYDAYFTLTVLPSFRDKGGGKKLISILLDHLRENDVHGVCTLIDTPGSLAFCERLGFVRIKKLNNTTFLYGLKF